MNDVAYNTMESAEELVVNVEGGGILREIQITIQEQLSSFESPFVIVLCPQQPSQDIKTPSEYKQLTLSFQLYANDHQPPPRSS